MKRILVIFLFSICLFAMVSVGIAGTANIIDSISVDTVGKWIGGLTYDGTFSNYR